MTSNCQTAGELAAVQARPSSRWMLFVRRGNPHKIPDEIGVTTEDSVVFFHGLFQFFHRLREALHVGR